MNIAIIFNVAEFIHVGTTFFKRPCLFMASYIIEKDTEPCSDVEITGDQGFKRRNDKMTIKKVRTKRRQLDLINNKLIKNNEFNRVLGEKLRYRRDTEVIISTVIEERKMNNPFKMYG